MRPIDPQRKARVANLMRLELAQAEAARAVGVHGPRYAGKRVIVLPSHVSDPAPGWRGSVYLAAGGLSSGCCSSLTGAWSSAPGLPTRSPGLWKADGSVMPVLVERGRERRRVSARVDPECRVLRDLRHGAGSGDRLIPAEADQALEPARGQGSSSVVKTNGPFSRPHPFGPLILDSVVRPSGPLSSVRYTACFQECKAIVVRLSTVDNVDKRTTRGLTWIEESTVQSWSPTNERVQGLWTALTGDAITAAKGWATYKPLVELRHGFVHRALGVHQDDAERFIAAAEQVVAHIAHVMSTVTIEAASPS